MAQFSPASLNLMLQRTDTLGGFTHNSYFQKAATLLKDFQIGLQVSTRVFPEIEYPGMTVDASNVSDVAKVRELAEKHTPGMRGSLRVIFCRFPLVAQTGEKYYGVTEGGRRPLEGGALYPDFILINVGKRRFDDSTLIHEMIHATGLDTHDSDPASLFAGGEDRTGMVLKPEHAERLRNAFFARPA